MKRILIFSALILHLLTSSVQAKTIKVVSLEHFSTEFPVETFNVQTLTTEELPDGIFIEKGTIISGYVVKVHGPKRLKRNSYFEFKPTLLTYKGRTLNIKDTKLVAKVVEQKRIDPVALTGNVAIKAANLVLLGSSQVISFTLGAANGEEGERIKAGLQRMYKDSFFSLAENGEHLDIDVGDILFLKLKKIY